MSTDLKLVVLKPAPKEYQADVWNAFFVSRSSMRLLYQEAYGEDKATDVLSLRHTLQPGMGGLSGEIVICPAVARVAARRLRTNVETELATLLVHGLLHLSGLDHDTASDRSRFEQLTRDIMITQSLKAVSLWSV